MTVDEAAAKKLRQVSRVLDFCAADIIEIGKAKPFNDAFEEELRQALLSMHAAGMLIRTVLQGADK